MKLFKIQKKVWEEFFLNNFKTGKAFLRETQNPEATKENIDEFDYVRILNSYVENKHHKVKKH